MVDSATDSLVLPQAAEEADLSGEDLVVGNLVQQLFTCKQHKVKFLFRNITLFYWKLYQKWKNQF